MKKLIILLTTLLVLQGCSSKGDISTEQLQNLTNSVSISQLEKTEFNKKDNKLVITTNEEVITKEGFDTLLKSLKLNSFKGKIKQIPPMYSAIKIDGKKLYDLARKGIEVERAERDVEISEIREIKVIRPDKNSENAQNIKISFYVKVSSGTYIRSLVYDIGEKLGVFATMTKLVRTKVTQLG